MEQIALGRGDARLTVSTHGAECMSWRIGRRELLWERDPDLWDGVAPILFPVCGWTRKGAARVGSRSYPLGLHGFARQCRFQVSEIGADRASLVLTDDPATRALYPFAFCLRITFELGPASLTIQADVLNRGLEPMPYAFGLHPGFRIDPAEPARIVFDEEEAAEVPVIAPGGLFSPERRIIALESGRILDLGPEAFAREALCFVPARSRGLRLESGQGPALRVDYPGFDNLVLWSRPGAPFLCIEPWTGFGDPVDFTGDLFAKPGMKVLDPGASAEHRAMFSLSA